MRNILVAIALSLSLGIMGCQTMETKAGAGQGLGALIGGAIGAIVGDPNEEKLAFGAIGAVIGGLVGHHIGQYLDQQDKAAIESATARSLETVSDGETQKYTNPDTGVTAAITAKETRTEAKTIQIVHERSIAPPPALDIIGATYVATTGANIRPEPSKRRKSVDYLAAGSTIDVVGKVSRSPWYMLARDGKSIGYTHASLLKPVPKSAGKGVLTTKSKVMKDLDVYKSDDSVVLASVQSTTECRTVDYTIDVAAKGQREDSSFEACKGSDGAWVIDA